MELAGPLSSSEVLGVCLVDSTANQDSTHVIKGRVVAVYIEPVLACLSSPSVTITTKNQAATILSVATDIAGWHYPATPIHLHTTGAVIANNYAQGVPIHDVVNVEISNAQAGDYVNVYLLLE